VRADFEYAASLQSFQTVERSGVLEASLAINSMDRSKAKIREDPLPIREIRVAVNYTAHSTTGKIRVNPL